MSKPSGFERFMHRLRFCSSKNRQPKHSTKWKTGISDLCLWPNGGDGNPKTSNGSNLSGERSRQEICGQNMAADRMEDRLPSKSFSDDAEQQGSEISAGITSGSLSRFTQPSFQSGSSGNAFDEVEANRGTSNFGTTPMKKGQDIRKSLSDRDSETRTQQQLGTEDDVTVWQRKNARFLNTDDMIQQDFMESKSSGPLSMIVGGSSATQCLEENKDNDSDAAERKERLERTAIQVSRRNMIEIIPSGSEPFLRQYVNVPRDKLHHASEWDEYDSIENVYYHLDRVMVGSFGYENLPHGEGRNYQNATYQNYLGPNEDHSHKNGTSGCNNTVMPDINTKGSKTKREHAMNYMEVVVDSGPPTPFQEKLENSFALRKETSGYAIIDGFKTKKLCEMAQETKKRVKKSSVTQR